MNYKKILNDILKREFLFPKYQEKYVLTNGLIIYNKKSRITRDYKMKYVLAYDIETLKGKAKLLCRNTGKQNYIYNPTFIQCLDFLYYKSSKSNGYRFFFNIDFDISSILKLLSKKDLKLIDDLSKGISITYENYEMRWFRGKLFTLKKLNSKSHSGILLFTDLHSFFKTGLNDIAKEYLKDEKLDIIDPEKLNKSKTYWNKNHDNIIKYCIKDCLITEKVGKYLINAVIETIDCLPRFLVSPASLSKHYVRLNCFLDSIGVIPKKIIQIGYNTYRGGRFEIIKRGYFKETFIYDINSEYPKVELELPDMVNGIWRKQRNCKLPLKETLGYFDVLLDIPDDNLISTIPFLKRKSDIIKYPNGFILTWATWYDLDLIRKYIIKIRRSYIFFKTIKNHKPLKKAIEHLFKKKALHKETSKIKYLISKDTMNSYYGCNIEQHDVYDKQGNKTKIAGMLFNSVYASQITAKGRWMILKPIPKKKWYDLIGYHTDSIISEIPLNKYLIIDDKIGNWSDESSKLENKEGIILNTGMYQIGNGNYKKDKEGNFILDENNKKICIDIIKTRGIPKKFIGNWFDFCIKNKNLNKKTFLIKHMKKIREALVQDKNITDVNIMDDIKRTVNINSDTKRTWFSNFKNFNDLLSRNISSLPLILGKNRELKNNPLIIIKKNIKNKNKNN